MTRRKSSCGIVSVALALAAPALGADDAQFARGRKLFTHDAVPSCTVCHALKDAGSVGEIGPSLDELRPDRERVANALRNGIGNMPSFRATLTEEQILALAHYVAKATGGN